MTESILTQSRLKELLHYNPETGSFTRRVRTSNSIRVGEIAGCPVTSGHIQIVLHGRPYMAHRLAFLYMIGEFPLHDTDHINGKPSDNSFKNLRMVTRTENCRNQKKRNTNTSGAMGVYWNKAREKWHVRINKAKKREHLGFFDDFFEACCARKSAEIKYGYHANHGRAA